VSPRDGRCHRRRLLACLIILSYHLPRYVGACNRFTTGQDIFFKQREYSPGSSSGRELLAHELAHVVQQGGARVKRKLTVGAVDDPHEQEADRTAGQVTRSISEAAQRQSVPEEEAKKEEPLQAKLDDGPAQRQAEEEEKRKKNPFRSSRKKARSIARRKMKRKRSRCRPSVRTC